MNKTKVKYTDNPNVRIIVVMLLAIPLQFLILEKPITPKTRVINVINMTRFNGCIPMMESSIEAE